MNIHIHKLLPGSYANGPGKRNVVWLQGCTLRCPGCFNPLTHDSSAGKTITTEKLFTELTTVPCDGVTISGGEPFQQPEALLELLKLIREQSSLPVLLFSGYSYTELTDDPACSVCLPLIDALICGPYRQDLPPAYERFCSSSNQELILLSDRYKKEDFGNLPLSEYIIDGEGNSVLSGIVPLHEALRGLTSCVAKPTQTCLSPCASQASQPHVRHKSACTHVRHPNIS